MAYIITNGQEYLISDTTTTMNINESFKWSSINKANNVLEVMPKNLRNKGFKAVYVQSKDRQTEIITEIDKLGYSIQEKIKEISSFSYYLEQRQKWLIRELQTVDLEIVDIEHAAEFYVLNAAQGYKIYKMLHDARIKRREIKNELEEIKYTLGTQLRSDRLNNLEKTLIGIHNRKYSARVIKELFGVWKGCAETGTGFMKGVSISFTPLHADGNNVPMR